MNQENFKNFKDKIDNFSNNPNLKKEFDSRRNDIYIWVKIIYFRLDLLHSF